MRFCYKLLFVFLISIQLISCKKETGWDIDGAFPIAKSYLNMSNFFGDTLFKTDQNNLLHLAFSKTLINLTIDSLVKLPDTTVTISFTAPFNTALNPGALIYTNNSVNSTDREITFDISNGVELNKAIVRKGFLKVDYINTYAQPLNFTYQINSASLWGQMFTINQTIDGGSVSNAAVLTKTYKLDDLNLNLTGFNSNKINTLIQTYTISTDNSGQPDNLLPGQGLTINLSFIDVVPEYIQGYFGEQNVSFGPDSVLLGIMENLQTNNFALTQASINFNIINEFGIELSSSINKLKSIKTQPYSAVTLNSGNILQSINVNRANKTNNPSNPVFPWVKQLSLNTSNSNINDFIENLPNYLSYQATAKLNPLGNISAANDFAYYGRGLKVVADIDIPLSISADYFTLVNYAKTDLSQVSELNNINTCELILTAKNNYPFSASLQGYLINEQNQIIDSLFSDGNNTILSANVDGNNNVITYRDSKISAFIDKQKINNLKLCKQIKFVSKYTLANQPSPINIKNDSYLDLILSTKINYRVKAR